MTFAVAAAPLRLAAQGGEADMLFTRGVVEIERGEYAAAREHLSAARALRPNDAPVLFNLGVALNRLGEHAEALDALDLAVGLEPMHPGLNLERGYSLAGLGMYAEAIPILERAAAEEPDSGFACCLLGMSLAGVGEHEKALGQFNRAGALSPELGGVSSYRAALSLAALGRAREARDSLVALIAAEPPGSVLAIDARDVLDRLQKEASPKRWRLNATARYEYDSNVTLIPHNEALVDTSERGDFRFLNTSELMISPIVRPGYNLSVYYRFLNSVHNRIGDFNLQGHELAPTFTLDLGRVMPYVGYEFDYYFLDDCHQSYYRMNSVFGGIDVQMSRHALSRLSYRYAAGDYFLDFTEPEDNLDVRGANTVGLDHYLFLGGRTDRYFHVGVSYDRNNTSGRNFTYNGYAFLWELYLPLFEEVSLDAWARYLILDFPRNTDDRRDHRQEYNVMLIRPLNEWLDVAFNYGVTINDSRVPLYRFDRNIYSLIVGCHF